MEESDEGNDSDDEDYVEAFGGLDVEESSKNSDTSYSPDSEDTASYMKNPKKKGKNQKYISFHTTVDRLCNRFKKKKKMLLCLVLRFLRKVQTKRRCGFS